MQFELIIEGKQPSLNEFISAMNNNRYIGNKFKRETEQNITLQILKQVREKGIVEHLPLENIADFEFTYVETSKRRDKDNIASCKKFLFDAMVQCSVIKDDGWKYVGDFKENFIIGRENKVIIKITERKGEEL